MIDSPITTAERRTRFVITWLERIERRGAGDAGNRQHFGLEITETDHPAKALQAAGRGFRSLVAALRLGAAAHDAWQLHLVDTFDPPTRARRRARLDRAERADTGSIARNDVLDARWQSRTRLTVAELHVTGPLGVLANDVNLRVGLASEERFDALPLAPVDEDLELGHLRRRGAG